jgi:hypothetical protein
VAPLFAFFIVLYLRRDNTAESFLEAVDAHQKVVDRLKAIEGDAAARAMRDLVDQGLKHQQGLILSKNRTVPWCAVRAKRSRLNADIVTDERITSCQKY